LDSPNGGSLFIYGSIVLPLTSADSTGY
jgi:hypothetical protein